MFFKIRSFVVHECQSVELVNLFYSYFTIIDTITFLLSSKTILFSYFKIFIKSLLILMFHLMKEY